MDTIGRATFPLPRRTGCLTTPYIVLTSLLGFYARIVHLDAPLSASMQRLMRTGTSHPTHPLNSLPRSYQHTASMNKPVSFPPAIEKATPTIGLTRLPGLNGRTALESVQLHTALTPAEAPSETRLCTGNSMGRPPQPSLAATLIELYEGRVVDMMDTATTISG